MKPRTVGFVTATLTLGLLIGAARRSEAGLVFDNGPIDSANGLDSDAINYGFSEWQAFTRSARTTLIEAQVGLRVQASETPIGLDWSIGTTPFASDLGSGTSALTVAFHNTAFGFYDVYDAGFGITLAGPWPPGRITSRSRTA